MKNTKTHTNIGSFVSSFIANLDSRQQAVIKGRYGLGNNAPATLQAIGDKYGITRERVRQIEAVALDSLRKNLTDAYAKTFIQSAVQYIKSTGGVVEENQLISELQQHVRDKGTLASFANPAKFLLELSGKVNRYYDNYSDWYTFWYLTPNDKKKAQGFVIKTISAVDKKKDEALSGGVKKLITQIAKTNGISPAVAENYLAISRRFIVSPFNELGLVEWPEINPRTARDWAYVILKRENKPLHFSELSKLISVNRKNKTTNLQTIHNELIKDNRFVLVGRGLYGLSEFGLIPGTAREIISHILKKDGPLKSRDVVKRVKEQRMLKEGTILINLQNRKHFNCMPDGRYCIREA